MMNEQRQEQLSRIVIKGFKSIKEADITLKNINVLIGSNGAGKSNFVSVFSLLQSMLNNDLETYGEIKVADTLFHYGPKVTDSISLQFYYCEMRESTYEFTLSESNKLVRKRASHLGRYGDMEDDKYRQSQRQWRVFHFHDTGPKARIKLDHNISDCLFLQYDASNLAAFLYLLRGNYSGEYQKILKSIQRVAPYFKDFVLEPNTHNNERIVLRWQEKGCEDIFNASQLSDGTLRFACLATLLLQPTNLQPATIIMDEPDLGLHPYAMTIFAELVKKAASKKQVIMATQSAELLDHFEAEDVIVVDRTANGSEFKRLDSEKLAAWLDDDYSLGELWNKNLFGGRVAR